MLGAGTDFSYLISEENSFEKGMGKWELYPREKTFEKSFYEEIPKNEN
jgi:hypothetical protein